MTLSILLLTIASLLYAVALSLYVIRFFKHNLTSATSVATHLIELGFFVHTLEIFVQILSPITPDHAFHIPVVSLGEASGFFAWSLALIYLIVLRQLKTEMFALIIIPILIKA